MMMQVLIIYALRNRIESGPVRCYYGDWIVVYRGGAKLPGSAQMPGPDPNVPELYERLFQGVPGSGSGPVSQRVFLERTEIIKNRRNYAAIPNFGTVACCATSTT